MSETHDVTVTLVDVNDEALVLLCCNSKRGMVKIPLMQQLMPRIMWQGDVIYTSAATPDVRRRAVTYSLSGADAGLFAIDEATGEVRFAADTTPDHETTASYAITVTATVGSQSATQDVTISVTDVNDAPTLANAIVDQVATEGQGFSYTIPANTFADEDAGDTLTITVAETADWLSYDDATGVLSGTPPVGAADVTVTVTATDLRGGRPQLMSSPLRWNHLP